MAVTKISALASRARDFQDAPAFQLLAIPNYRRLTGGVALGFAAFNINLMAQSWLVLDMTNSKLWVGVVAGSSAATVMAFSLVAGALADRMDRKLLILISRIAQAVFALIPNPPKDGV